MKNIQGGLIACFATDIDKLKSVLIIYIDDNQPIQRCYYLHLLKQKR